MYKDADDDRSEYAPTDEEVDEKEKLIKEDEDGEMDKIGDAKMETIEDVPSTPMNGSGVQTNGADSIGSRVKQRKGGKQ